MFVNLSQKSYTFYISNSLEEGIMANGSGGIWSQFSGGRRLILIVGLIILVGVAIASIQSGEETQQNGTENGGEETTSVVENGEESEAEETEISEESVENEEAGTSAQGNGQGEDNGDVAAGAQNLPAAGPEDTVAVAAKVAAVFAVAGLYFVSKSKLNKSLS